MTGVDPAPCFPLRWDFSLIILSSKFLPALDIGYYYLTSGVPFILAIFWSSLSFSSFLMSLFLP